MDLKLIEALLEKYYAGETSLEEERKLKDFFGKEGVPADLEEEKIKFRFYSDALGEGIGVSDERLVSGLNPRPKTFHFFNFDRRAFAVSAMAAGILLIVGASFYMNKDAIVCNKINYGSNKNPQIAYAQTKKALLLISDKLNKGNTSLSKIAKLNEMQVLLTKKNTTK